MPEVKKQSTKESSTKDCFKNVVLAKLAIDLWPFSVQKTRCHLRKAKKDVSL